jgi:hypothetical protein
LIGGHDGVMVDAAMTCDVIQYQKTFAIRIKWFNLVIIIAGMLYNTVLARTLRVRSSR